MADANLALARTRVIAPFNGFVRDESVDVGQFVNPGQSLGRFFAADEVEVVVPLADANAAMIPGLWALGAGSGEQTVAARVVAQYGATRYAWDGYVDRADASVDNETRTIDMVQAWREELGILPYVRGITLSGEVIDLGNPIEAVLSHPDPDRLVQIAESVVIGLRNVQGIFDVRSDHTPGVREIQLELRPEARTLGLTLDDLAQQTRAAIFGAEAVRVQRGTEEVRAFVRLPTTERNAITDVEGFLIRTPGGAEMPLSQVARLSSGISPPAIRRRDGERVVTVTGDVDAAVISAGEANTVLTDELLAGLTAQNPDLTYLLGGEQQQQVQSLDALYRGFALAMLMIFALLVIRGNLTPA